MPHSRSIDFHLPIPLFPLPNCVLLPHATIPLHIFEARYRKMVSDALDSRGLIAMALFEGEEWKSQYQGNPLIRSHVCVGYIIQHQALPDGCYNLLLQGVCRARLVKELPVDNYRRAILEPTDTGSWLEIDLEEDRRRLEALFNDSQMQQLASINAIRNWLNDQIPTIALIDLAILSVCESLEDRYHMLVEKELPRRCQWLLNYLEGMRHSLRIAQRYDPGPSNDNTRQN